MKRYTGEFPHKQRERRGGRKRGREVGIEREREGGRERYRRETDRQTYRQTDKQTTDRQASSDRGGETDTGTHRIVQMNYF